MWRERRKEEFKDGGTEGHGRKSAEGRENSGEEGKGVAVLDYVERKAMGKETRQTKI